VVAVGVGAHYRGDFCGANGAQYRLDMAFAIDIRRVAYAFAAAARARVDNRNVTARADQPGLRAGIGIRRGIGRKHTSDQRFMLLCLACVDSVGPIGHQTDMAYRTAKKKGRFSKTAPQNRKGELGVLFKVPC
jgi:hypothetical protein